MRFADFMAEQQIERRCGRVGARAAQLPPPPTRVVSGRGSSRFAEFEMLVHSMEGERVVFRTPVEPPEHSRLLLETLGAVIVIDPSAPPIRYPGA